MRLDDVLDTAERFDVAGFGEILAVTTYLTGALIGKRVSINQVGVGGLLQRLRHLRGRRQRHRTPCRRAQGKRAAAGRSKGRALRSATRN